MSGERLMGTRGTNALTGSLNTPTSVIDFSKLNAPAPKTDVAQSPAAAPEQTKQALTPEENRKMIAILEREFLPKWRARMEKMGLSPLTNPSQDQMEQAFRFRYCKGTSMKELKEQITTQFDKQFPSPTGVVNA